MSVEERVLPPRADRPSGDRADPRAPGPARRRAEIPTSSPGGGGARGVEGADPRALDAMGDPASYLAHHSRSFQFATHWMPRSSREAVARVYAWCRYTDNLVDGPLATDIAEWRLGAWLERSRWAYEGGDSGIDLVNRVMREMAQRDIPFAYARDLVRAMRSDLHFSPFPDLDALRVYTYRAAGVVGRWLTELHGVHDAWMLDRATALGQGMQLTNILRDVGEDLRRGRIYLPVTELRRFGVTVERLEAIRQGTGQVDRSYGDLMEYLMGVADAQYALADAAIPWLPSEFRRAAAVASAVYRGIHQEIRRNGYDNLRRRAYTTRTRKALLASGALVALARPVAAGGVDAGAGIG